MHEAAGANRRYLVLRTAVAVVLLLAVTSAAAGAQSLAGPKGTSDTKVLVLGMDGTRIDLVDKLIKAGKAPNLKEIRDRGYLVPSLLDYAPPEALTLSEVGWCSIATGVWPPKHGVNGYMLNKDPGQATKNGFDDFLTHIEKTQPGLSTFVASDWSNIALHENGGPIFSDDIDAKFALAAADTIDDYDKGDEQASAEAARYIRATGPDAGFVYFGVIDEAGHAEGSATPAYSDAIERTDKRIGRLLDAIKARPARERWLVLVTADHGQLALTEGSLLAHGGGSEIERTSFVGMAGFGADTTPDDPHIVDIAPTVYSYLGVTPADNLDGKALTGAPAIPKPTITFKHKGKQLIVTVAAPQGAPDLGTVRVKAKGRPAKVVKSGGRKVKVKVRTRRHKAKVRIT